MVVAVVVVVVGAMDHDIGIVVVVVVVGAVKGCMELQVVFAKEVVAEVVVGLQIEDDFVAFAVGAVVEEDLEEVVFVEVARLGLD